MPDNEYDQLLAGDGQAPGTEYDRLLQEEDAERRTALRVSLRATADTPPDTKAQALAIAQRHQVPVAIVERDLDFWTRQDRGTLHDEDRLLRETPALATQLQNPNFAGVARDDLEALSAIERTLRIGRNLAGAAGAGLMGFSRGIWGLIQAGAETMGADDLARFAAASADVAEGLSTRARGPQTGAGFVERSVYGGIESVGQFAPGLIAGIFTGGAGTLTTIGVSTFGQSYTEARSQGASLSRAAGYGAIQGGVEVATELIPAKRLLGDLATRTPWFRTLVHQLVPELAGEQVATVLQDLNDWALLPENANRPIGAYLADRPSAAAATLISTIVAVGATTTATAGTARVLEQLGAAARDSKTLTRSPDQVAALVNGVIAEGGPAAVHLPIETFTTYFQSKNQDPAQIAAQLTGDATAYARAQQTGEDLAVPMARYLTEIASTEHNAFFAQEARLSPETLNAREQTALEQAIAAEASTAIAAPVDVAPAVQVGEAVQAMLTDAGVEPSTARSYARLYEHAFAALGTRAGLDPVQLFERYGLTVTREGLGPARAAGETGETRFAQDPRALSSDARTRIDSLTPAEGPGDSRAVPFPVLERAEASRLVRAVDRAHEQRVTVPIEQLIATQPTVSADVLRGQTTAREGPPLAIAHDGRYYLADGTHRAVAAWARGDTTLEVLAAPVRAEWLTSPPAYRSALDDLRLRQDERGEIHVGDRQVAITLLKHADLSTFLHESAHFYLEVLGDVAGELAQRDAATLTETQQQLVADYRTLLGWFGVTARTEITAAQHEQFARGFEAYLLEGKAPSTELRSVFARVRAWLVSLYRSIGTLRVELSPEVRGVMDRLLATDAAIAAVQQDMQGGPLFTDTVAQAAGLSDADRRTLKATVDQAADRARERLQARLLADLQREREAWWKAELEAVRVDVTPEVQARPVYRALALLAHGTQPDGSPLPAGVEPIKLSKAALLEQFGPDILAKLAHHDRVFSHEGGVPPSVAAELLGFPSGEALVDALIRARPMAEAIDAAADARMRERHGDLLLDGNLVEEARGAVLESAADVFAAELRALEGIVSRGRRQAPAPSLAQLRHIAEQRVAGMAIEDLRPATFAAAARRAGRRALEAAGRQDFAGALQAKQQQLLNAALYRAATDAREMVDQARASFRPVFGRDPSLAQRYNLDLVAAARALLVQFELAPKTMGAESVWQYLEQVRKYDPDTYDELQAAIEAASQPGRPYRELTVDEFVALRDAVHNLWHLARRSKQIVLEGRAYDLAEVRTELEAGLSAISTPKARRGYDRAVSKWEKTKLYLLGAVSALRRVESWVDAIDGRDPRGAFRRILFTPISEAAARYRLAKKTALERYLAIVKTVEASLTPHDIAAPEIGYTFTGKAELLHALLHTGNASNLSKLLRGRQWGAEGADGTLDTTRWDAFIRRLWQTGTLTKIDYDYVQAVWDLLEDLKPEAQAVHHDLFGTYFAEVTAHEVMTPFGTYRGGYMSAIVDPFIATDAAQRADREALEETPSSFMFPTTGRGFTKGRIEAYAKPLALDLRVVPVHLDKVLRFIHLEPHVKDAARLVTNRGFRRALDTFDPTVGGELLVPWLQRAAKQTVDTPAQGWGGRGADRLFRALRRRTGMQIMVGNVLNTLQQFTGISVAALRVPPRALSRALWRYVRQPRVLAAAIAEKSTFMRTRTTTQTIEVQQHIDDLLLNPSTYEQARAFAEKHGYFLQAATQNVVDVITWSGAYDHAVAEGATEAGAVRQADAAVRATQGSFNPEDLSRFETGTPFMRAFTMFSSYFNFLANTLGTDVEVTVRELGLRKGAGRLFYIYLFGFLIPALLSDAIVRLGSGEPWDEDDDGVLDDFLLWFFGSQQRTATAMLPGIGPAINAGINTFNHKWYDDRISASPIVSALESAVRAPVAIYRSIAEGEMRKRDVRDVLTAVGLATGLPAGAVARPIGYAVDVAQGNEEPSDAIDAARGLVVGR